jgi:heptosyltransferase I
MSAQKICILRLSAIGDVTHVLPVIQQLRQSLPDVKITWVIGRVEYQLVSGLPGVEFIVFDKSQGLQAYFKLRKTLNERRFDILLHMQVAFRANVASLMISADQRVGYDRGRSKDLHGLFINQRIVAHPEQHVLDVLRSFLQPLGLDSFSAVPQWNIPLTDSDYRFAKEHIDSDRPTLVMSPVSSHPSRDWLVDRYAAVADYAIKEFGFQVIFSGGSGRREHAFIQSIEAEMEAHAMNLVGRMTLKESAALLGAADLLIAPDTGPVHIANAMGTVVIGLYAASNPRRTGPYNALPWCINRYAEAAKKFKGQSVDSLRWGARINDLGVMELISTRAVTDKLANWHAEYWR